jgi:hypothetical protein
MVRLGSGIRLAKRKEEKMLKQVQHDTIRELLCSLRHVSDIIPFLPAVEMTRIGVDGWQGYTGFKIE